MSYAHAQSVSATAASTAPSAAEGSSSPSDASADVGVAEEQRGTVRSAGVVAGTTMLSRVLGLGRDVAAAALFGAGWIWDAFVLAFLLPNLFRRLFGEGSLAAAFVPVYTSLRETRGDHAAARLVSNALTALVLFLAALAAAVVALGFALPDGAWALLFGASAGGDAKLELFRALLPIMMPFVVLVCATALIGAALNVHGHFFVPAFASVLLNVVWLGGIGAAVWLVPATQPQLQCLVVAGAILVGGALGLGHHLWVLRRALAGARGDAPGTNVAAQPPAVTTRLDLRDPDLRTIGQRMGPAIIGLGVLQISVLLDSVIAEIFVAGDGAVSALYFGNRLMQLPLALLGVAMAIAIFPVLSRHASRNESARLADSLRHATRLTLFLSLPACVGLVVLAEPIVGTVYGWGAFDAEAMSRTSLVLACYAAGLIAASLRMLQVRAFYAVGDTRTPTWIAVRLVALNVALNLVLVHTPLQEAGLALSTSLTGWLGFVWLERRLAATMPRVAGQPQEPVYSSAMRALAASAAMAAVAWFVAGALVADSAAWQRMDAWPRIGALTLVLVASVATFAGVAALLRTREMRELVGAVRRRRRKGAASAVGET